MIEIKVTDDTPISLLTVGQQKELFLTWFSELLGKKIKWLQVLNSLNAMYMELQASPACSKCRTQQLLSSRMVC